MILKTIQAITLTILTLTLSTIAHAEDFYRTLEFNLKPDQSVAFQDLMKEALMDTRAFAGCKYVAMFVDQDDPTKVFLYEIWDKQESYKAYSAWRGETKFGDLVGPYMAGPPTAKNYSLIQE
jgi:quinol monooxygenase YgiN